MTTLLKNPFSVLGCNPRDDRRRIVALAEEKSLSLDHDLCQKARADITNPRTRLIAEMAWLPGMSPRKADQLVQKVLADPLSIRGEHGLPTLARANLMAAAFESITDFNGPESVAEFIGEFASLVENLSAEEIVRDINEDRAVAGFPEIGSVELADEELAERRRYYRTAIKSALNRMEASTLIFVMSRSLEAATAFGEDQAPHLIDELVDSYEIETKEFLEQEAANAQKLIDAAKNKGQLGEPAVKPLIDRLEAVARNWEKVAYPIQLSAKARGIVHRPSAELAYSIRGLAIQLFNENDQLTQATRITKLLRDIFPHVPELVEKVEEDAQALQNIFRDRKNAQVKRAEWEREITYSAEIGLVFKDRLSISPQGVSWGNQTFPLDSITRVRWGAISRSINGIPTGTDYTIAFGDNRKETEVSLRRKEVFTFFLDKLWRAVCVRLISELLEALKAGREIRFGEGVVLDDAITLVKHKFLGANESVRCLWSQVHYWSAGGSLHIASREEKKTYIELSYISSPNAHILEAAISYAFKKPGMRRLSEVLD